MNITLYSYASRLASCNRLMFRFSSVHYNLIIFISTCIDKHFDAVIHRKIKRFFVHVTKLSNFFLVRKLRIMMILAAMVVYVPSLLCRGIMVRTILNDIPKSNECFDKQRLTNNSWAISKVKRIVEPTTNMTIFQQKLINKKNKKNRENIVFLKMFVKN